MNQNEATRSAKSRLEEQKRLRKVIVSVGDDLKTAIKNITGVCGTLEDSWDDDQEFIVDTLVDCIQHLPLKSGIYGCMMGLFALSNIDAVTTIMDRCFFILNDAIKKGAVTRAQMMLRFFVECTNSRALSEDSLFKLLEDIMDLSAADNAESGGDLGVYLVLSCLPWISEKLYAVEVQTVDKFVSDAENYLKMRGDKKWKIAFSTNRSPGPDRLEALVEALKTLKADNWALKSIGRFHTQFTNFEKIKTQAKLPRFTLIQADMKKHVFQPQLMVTFEEGLLPLHDLWILTDIMFAITEFFHKHLEECAKQLLFIPVLHQAFDTILVGFIFDQLLRLPNAPHVPLFYTRLLQQISSLETSVKPCIGAHVLRVIQHVDRMDDECLDTLASFIAYHLHYNNYDWEWSKWVAGAEPSPTMERFFRNIFTYLLRLSFHANLQHHLPDYLHKYMPKEPLVNQKFGPSTPEFAELTPLIRIKDVNEFSVLEFLKGIHSKPRQEAVSLKRKREKDEVAWEDGEEVVKSESKVEGVKQESKNETVKTQGEWTTTEVIELFIYTLLQNGSKTPTHEKRLMDSHSRIFEKMAPINDEKEAHQYLLAIVRSVVDFWQHNGQRLELTIVTLLAKEVLTFDIIIEYLLNYQTPEDCDKLHCWNVLNSVLRKKLEALQMARAELALAKRLSRHEQTVTAQKHFDVANAAAEKTFLDIFRGLVNQYKKSETDLHRQVFLDRIMSLGRKYRLFLKPYLANVRPLLEEPQFLPIYESFSAVR